jgi:uncharacterized protein (UPF0147 family)
MVDGELKEVIELLNDLKKDVFIPKNVKDRIESTINILKDEDEVAIKVNKALHELEEVADDANLQPFTRTQIWNIVSVLEKLT